MYEVLQGADQKNTSPPGNHAAVYLASADLDLKPVGDSCELQCHLGGEEVPI